LPFRPAIDWASLAPSDREPPLPPIPLVDLKAQRQPISAARRFFETKAAAVD
jgi:hypothetical protein